MMVSFVECYIPHILLVSYIAPDNLGIYINVFSYFSVKTCCGCSLKVPGIHII